MRYLSYGAEPAHVVRGLWLRGLHCFYSRELGIKSLIRYHGTHVGGMSQVICEALIHEKCLLIVEVLLCADVELV